MIKILIYLLIPIVFVLALDIWLTGSISLSSFKHLFTAYGETFLQIAIYLLLWYMCVYIYKKIKARKNNKQ